MIEIHPLHNIQTSELNGLIGPYTCTETYRVRWDDHEQATGFSLERVPLAEPYVGRYNHIDEAWVETYLRPSDCAFGAYDGKILVGALIAETRAWNNSLWVHEFHVAEAYRRQGIGRMLMEHAAAEARKAGLRVIVCETQNRNANAIQAYRALGFRVEGIDISYYTNEDYPDHGIAVFMKRRV
jgi:ribosomal protein S18 acetylase RimI-like enzyme